MKTEILNSYKITKEMALEELSSLSLSDGEIDEYLDIISAINEGYNVFNIDTNDGRYLLYVKSNKSKLITYLSEKKKSVKIFISDIIGKMSKNLLKKSN